MLSEPMLRVQLMHAAACIDGQQSWLFVGAEKTNRVEVTSLRVAGDVAQEVPAARAVRQLRGCDRRDAAERARTVSIERDNAMPTTESRLTPMPMSLRASSLARACSVA